MNDDGVGLYETVSASRFDVAIDPEQPRIGLKITMHAGGTFVLPIEYEHAKWIAEDILRTIYTRAPELFTDEPIELSGE